MSISFETIKLEKSGIPPFVNAFLIVKGSSCVLVDTGFEEHFEKVKEVIGEKKLEFIIITHAHLDHIGSCAALKKEFGCKVVLSEYENAKFEVGENSDLIPRTDFYKEYMKTLKKGKVYNEGKGDIIVEKETSIEEYGIKILMTPGHTKGSISVICVQNVICGDLLSFTETGKIVRPGFLQSEDDFKKSMKTLFEQKEFFKKMYCAHSDKFMKFGDLEVFCKENNI